MDLSGARTGSGQCISEALVNSVLMGREEGLKLSETALWTVESILLISKVDLNNLTVYVLNDTDLLTKSVDIFCSCS